MELNFANARFKRENHGSYRGGPKPWVFKWFSSQVTLIIKYIDGGHLY